MTLSRANWLGKDVPSRVRVTIGPLENRIVDGQVVQSLASVTDSATWTIHSGRERTFTLRTPPPPFKVEVHVAKTFVPAKLDRHSQDTRELGAQVGFEFVPFG